MAESCERHGPPRFDPVEGQSYLVIRCSVCDTVAGLRSPAGTTPPADGALAEAMSRG